MRGIQIHKEQPYEQDSATGVGCTTKRNGTTLFSASAAHIEMICFMGALVCACACVCVLCSLLLPRIIVGLFFIHSDSFRYSFSRLFAVSGTGGDPIARSFGSVCKDAAKWAFQFLQNSRWCNIHSIRTVAAIFRAIRKSRCSHHTI